MRSLPYSSLRFYDKILGSSKYKHKYCIGQLGTIYVCVHKSTSRCVYIYPNMHRVRRADSTQARQKLEWFVCVIF